MEDKERNMEIMLKEEDYLNEKMHNVKQRIAETDNDNNKFHIMKEYNQVKNDLANKQMKQVEIKHEIDANQLYAELEKTKKQMTLIESQNEAYLPKALANKLKAEEQSALVKKAYELSEQSKTLKAAIDKGYDIDSKEMIEQITDRINKQKMK